VPGSRAPRNIPKPTRCARREGRARRGCSRCRSTARGLRPAWGTLRAGPLPSLPRAGPRRSRSLRAGP